MLFRRVIVGIVAMGCVLGVRALAAEKESAKPAQGAATPEALANHVHAALKAKDFKAFRSICVIKEDMEVYLKAAKSAEERAELQKYTEERFTPALEAQLKAYFDLAVEKIDWNSVEVIKTVVAPKKERDGQPPMVPRITLELSTQWKLTIHDMPKLERGWVIGDDDPIRVHDPKGKFIQPQLPEQKPSQPPQNSGDKSTSSPDSKPAPPPGLKDKSDRPAKDKGK